MKAINIYGIWLGCLLFCSNALAECDGQWQVDFTPAAAQVDTKGQGVWIPAHVSVDRGLNTCAEQLLLRQPQSGPLMLQGQSTMADYQLMRANRQTLNQIGRDYFVLPVQGMHKVDFWVYVAKGQLLEPGRYQGLLDVKLQGAKLGEQSWQQHAFEYTVTPFVRVKLSGVSGQWLQAVGTSVHVNLGDLSQRNQRELPVYVESNTLVSMRVSSKHAGALVHTSNAQNRVPYKMLFAGQEIVLTSEALLDIAQRPLMGKNVSLVFENQASPFARAGHYEDVVTVSIFAR